MRSGNDTLLVTIGSLAAVEARSRDAMERALADGADDADAADDESGDTPRRLTFADAQALFAVFSPEAVELLRAVARERPATVAEAASLCGLSPETAAETLERLATHDVVAFEDARPVVPYDELRIDLGLREENGRRAVGV